MRLLLATLLSLFPYAIQAPVAPRRCHLHQIVRARVLMISVVRLKKILGS